jgi:hypothetical protein
MPHAVMLIVVAAVFSATILHSSHGGGDVDDAVHSPRTHAHRDRNGDSDRLAHVAGRIESAPTVDSDSEGIDRINDNDDDNGKDNVDGPRDESERASAVVNTSDRVGREKSSEDDADERHASVEEHATEKAGPHVRSDGPVRVLVLYARTEEHWYMLFGLPQWCPEKNLTRVFPSCSRPIELHYIYPKSAAMALMHTFDWVVFYMPVPHNDFFTDERYTHESPEANIYFYIPPRSAESRKRQLWIAAATENDVRYKRMNIARLRASKLFDLVISHDQSADEYFSRIGSFWQGRITSPDDFRHRFLPFSERRSALFYLYKLCNPPSGRDEMMWRIADKLVDVPLYAAGFCMRNKNRYPVHEVWRSFGYRSDDMMSKVNLIKRFRLAASMENAIAPGYVTEKLFQALYAGTIPVHLSTQDFRRFTPGFDGEGVIDMSKFENSNAAAAFLEAVGTNETLFNSMLAWKDRPFQPSFLEYFAHSQETMLCRLCRRLVDERHECPRDRLDDPFFEAVRKSLEEALVLPGDDDLDHGNTDVRHESKAVSQAREDHAHSVFRKHQKSVCDDP